VKNTKFTKGPFTAHHREGVSYVASNTKIADVYSTAFRDRENQEANANLFAASFEMLQACKRVLDAYEKNWDQLSFAEMARLIDLDSVKRAIDKVEGVV